MAGVGFFHDHNPAIATQFPRKLAVSDIHGVNLGGTGLEQAIRETPSGRAKVNGRLAGYVEVKVLQRVCEFVAAATDEFLRRGERELVGLCNGIAGFAGGLTV